MFKKKKCKRCGRKIDSNFSYCPSCGANLRDEEDQKDYGFLGRNDETDFFKNQVKLPFGFNFIFKNLIKEMDKQFKELDKQIGIEEKKEKLTKEQEKKNQIPKIRRGGVSINISSNSSKDGIPVIKIRGFGNMPEFKEFEKELKEKTSKKSIKEKKIKPIEISEEKAKKLAKLPREEAESKVRRLSGRVIYEIELPGVKSLKDVVVNELENSIEIKAFTKDKAYFKFLPVALPLLKYALKKDKLVLELGEE